MSSVNTSRSMSSSAAITSVWSRDFKRVIRNKSVLPSIFVIPAIFIAIFYGAFSVPRSPSVRLPTVSAFWRTSR